MTGNRNEIYEKLTTPVAVLILLLYGALFGIGYYFGR